jgi:NAD+ kinase
MIAIGGDGTLLHAARLVASQGASRDIPLLGINRGRLGFLTDVMPQDMGPSVDAVLAGDCEATAGRCCCARLVDAGGAERSELALNDVILRRETGRLLDFDAGRRALPQFPQRRRHGDRHGHRLHGLCLSCGGPIVEPRLNDAGAGADRAAHAVHRPIVVPGT